MKDVLLVLSFLVLNRCSHLLCDHSTRTQIHIKDFTKEKTYEIYSVIYCSNIYVKQWLQKP